jgi:hypothetical protein
MKLFWLFIVTIEAVVVIAFCMWASSADYFLRMPVSVRHGSSVWSIIALRAASLTIVLGMFDAAIAAWIRGVGSLGRSEREWALFWFAGAIVVFLCACALLVVFVVVGFAQY